MTARTRAALLLIALAGLLPTGCASARRPPLGVAEPIESATVEDRHETLERELSLYSD